MRCAPKANLTKRPNQREVIPSTVYYKSFDAVHSFMFWDNSHMMSTLEDSRGLENEVREHALPSQICTKTRRLEESIILLIHVNYPSLWQVSTYLLHCRLLVDQLVRGPVRQALWRGKQQTDKDNLSTSREWGEIMLWSAYQRCALQHSSLPR